MDSGIDWHTARALLEWQLEMGVDETLSETPVDRFAEHSAQRAAAEAKKAAVAVAHPDAAPPAQADPVQEAEAAARGARDLDALREALAAYPHCALKKGARSLVFCDGVPGSRVMIVGEAPGREEDLQAKPFVGRAGQLLDRMLAPIGLARTENVYITNVLPWRPPQNRDPKPDEIAMLLPFLKRHIELAAPEILVIVGNISCQALLGRRGITRLRGQWTEAEARPALPIFHPAYLLRNPAAKREAWADMLALQARLRRPS
ncbi:uracil-DNA glycosylase [Pseudoponticoccus marisrubri]|uniref:Type-4 uracil-DNA glycosylase n=1 Tax=Pseudoponticoccus marisrubri TaxID=1685382 RepID=A0A0W7WGM4_9RHOB|nr:uracil-DNA glycosylase [Pseudoponticoccus marisrubri]KUF09741.1 uracil-DNA glycosylase [Pseudoponticoccus marisrubri]